MARYNTNLAAEFWALSMLHRLGADAALTLGNRKQVDIVVTGSGGRVKTVDVKGLARRYDWPADNIPKREEMPDNHFYVFLTFDGGIENPSRAPSVWVVPGTEVHRFTKRYDTRTVIARSLIRDQGDPYKQAWFLLTGPRTS